MLYIEYYECKKKYDNILEKYSNLLDEVEKLFLKTQPKATDCSKIRTSEGTPPYSFDDYLIEKELKNLDNNINEAKNIVNARKEILDLKEIELRKSKEWLDIVYVYYYLDKYSLRKISKRIPLSTTEIYRKKEKIAETLNLEQKGTKRVLK